MHERVEQRRVVLVSGGSRNLNEIVKRGVWVSRRCSAQIADVLLRLLAVNKNPNES
jgi:hypothetical protein